MDKYQVTPDEMIVVSIARQVKDYEVVAQGIATPLVAAGYLLARKTHAPHLYFVSAIGQGICRDPAPLGISTIEHLWLDRALTNAGFVVAAADVLPNLRPKEFFRPGQIDACGNMNNIAFCRDYLSNLLPQPRLRLPGSGGIPDVSTFLDDIYLYVPRHSRVTFVQSVDVLSGIGYHPARVQGSGPVFLVSDLGQFDFENGRMRLISHHPNTSIEKIIAKTGFELEIARDVHETPIPTREELDILRNEVDPLGIRKLELLSGNSRRQALLKILAYEERHR